MNEQASPTSPSEQSTPASAQVTQARSQTPTQSAFRSYIGQHWADRAPVASSLAAGAPYAAERRAKLSALHRGERLIFPAGGRKVRANDTDYRFRPDSTFTWLTAWGAHAEPDSLLVLEPRGASHEAVLYFRPAAGRDTEEFYADASIGEFWTGPRPGLSDIADLLGIRTRRLEEYDGPSGMPDQLAALVFRDASELRLIKDEWEIAELREAVHATHRAFNRMLGSLPRAASHPRGQRVIEGEFDAEARLEGNGVGYDSIAGGGAHGCILHWTRNDGPVRPGDLLLVDAGVEAESLYTADITRTVPVTGAFSSVQREVYEAVLEANEAAFAVASPGTPYKAMHEAAMRVIAERTAGWGLLPVSAEASLKPENQHHRRYMVHGTGHHLGLDVHDGALARDEVYRDAPLQPGMVFTIEPGLYFQPDDLTVPEELRGIGIRIEDDVVMTESGWVNLSADIPRTADAVEAWVQEHTAS